jgi:Fibronectin type III domain
VTSTSFIVNWTEPNNTRGSLKEYHVNVVFLKLLYINPSHCDKKNPPGDNHTVSVDKPREYNFTKGEPYCRYSVQVQANNQNIEGPFSTAIIVSTLEGMNFLILFSG